MPVMRPSLLQSPMSRADISQGIPPCRMIVKIFDFCSLLVSGLDSSLSPCLLPAWRLCIQSAMEGAGSDSELRTQAEDARFGQKPLGIHDGRRNVAWRRSNDKHMTASTISAFRAFGLQAILCKARVRLQILPQDVCLRSWDLLGLSEPRHGSAQQVLLQILGKSLRLSGPAAKAIRDPRLGSSWIRDRNCGYGGFRNWGTILGSF